MKAIMVREFGGPGVMKLEETPEPSAGDGEVLVRIRAAGVNPADTYARTGNYIVTPTLPYTPGIDGAGEVSALGPGVTGVNVGDRVYVAPAVTGTYAEYARAHASRVHLLPEHISFSQGAGLFVPYGTAYHALRQRAAAHAGETLLVHGASGGVGTASIQWARSMGLAVFGTAGSARGLELVLREGAHRAFDHTAPGYREEILAATEGRGVDIILEMLANVNLGADLKLIAQGGRVIVIGSRGDATVTPRDLMARRGSIHGVMLWKITEDESAQIHEAIGKGLMKETLRPVVGREFPLADAPAAHEAVMAKGAYGKIVLIP